MRARRYIYELFIAGPIFLMAYFAIVSRINVATFQTPCYSGELDARILAYREPVLGVQSYCSNQNQAERAAQIRKVADLWLEASRDGRLKPLHMEYRNDTTRDGVKSQIRGAAQRLAGDLTRLGESLGAKNPDLGLRYCLDAVAICQIVKFSDPFSIGYFSAKERAILVLAKELETKSSARSKEEFATLVRQIIDQRKLFTNVLAQAESMVRLELAQRGDNASSASALFDGRNSEHVVLALSHSEEEQEETRAMITGVQFARTAFEGELRFAIELLNSLKN